MKHFTHEQMLDYISNAIPESERVEFEDHLYTCDPCLEIYAKFVEEQGDRLPELAEGDLFTVQILEKLPSQQKVADKKKRSILQHSLFHYGVAAAVTLVFMTSGVFQGITSLPSTVEGKPLTTQEQSISNHFMNKALSFIEIMEPKQKEVNE